MTITINGTTGITNDGGYTGDGVVFADTTPANTLVTTTGGNVGIGTSSPAAKLDVSGTSRIRTDVSSATVIATATNAAANAYATYRIDSNDYQFYTTGSEKMRIDSSGNLLVGATAADSGSRLLVRGASSTTADYAMVVERANGSDILSCRNDGSVYLPATYGFTTGSAANVFMASDASLYRSTSSLKYKKNVQDATHGLDDVLKLRSVTYEGKSEADAGKTFGGLIAEEVHAAGLTEFVQYAEDGTPDALAYGNMVSLAFKAIQEQQAIITAQAAQIQQLREKVLEVEEGASNMLVENTNNLYETITALTARVEALEGTQP